MKSETIDDRLRAGVFLESDAETLLRKADDAIGALLFIAKKSPKTLKPLARQRYTWPAFISLSKRIEDEFDFLKGVHNQTGEWTSYGEIELGAGLPYRINRRTSGGVFLIAAADVLRILSYIDPPDLFPAYLAKFVPEIVGDPKDRKKHALSFYNRMGDITKSNWEGRGKWKEVFAHVLTMRYGPIEQRLERVPSHLKSNKLFLAALRHFNTPLLNHLWAPEVRAIVGSHTQKARKKSTDAQWNELKNEVIKKAEKMIPKK